MLWKTVRNNNQDPSVNNTEMRMFSGVVGLWLQLTDAFSNVIILINEC